MSVRRGLRLYVCTYARHTGRRVQRACIMMTTTLAIRSAICGSGDLRGVFQCRPELLCIGLRCSHRKHVPTELESAPKGTLGQPALLSQGARGPLCAHASLDGWLEPRGEGNACPRTKDDMSPQPTTHAHACHAKSG